MAIENAKTLNVRIKNKYDSYENWMASGLILEAGEIAIAHTTVDVNVDNGVAKHVALLMKVGNGSDTFDKLPWLSAKAADVLAVCKDEAALTEFVNTVISNAGIATDEAMQALAKRVTDAEGEIDTLQADLNTEKTGLKARVTTAEAAIVALEELIGDEGTVAAQIDAKIAALNLADTYAAKVHGHEIAEVNGLSDAIAAAKKAGTDANSALEAYKTLNDAAVKVNTDAIAAIKNGETLDNFKEVEEALAGKQAAGNYTVVGHKHEIADVNGLSDAIADAKKAGTDAASAAAKALTDAKAYTDTEMARLVGDTNVGVQIDNKITALKLDETYDAKGDAAQALVDAKAYTDGKDSAMNTRVLALEAIDHDHANKTVLDGITAEKVAAWDAAEANAIAHADDLDEAMDARVLALEGKFTGEDSVADQIADAVAAEAKLRDDADKALQALIEANDADILALQGLVGDSSVETRINAEKERAEAAEKANADAIKAISDDYLKAADKTELEGKITANANAIELLTNGVSAEEVDGVNDLIQYVKDHGAEVTGIKADIKANADAIAAIPQADWNQNDSTAADFIKNRPFYEEEGSASIVTEGTKETFPKFVHGSNTTYYRLADKYIPAEDIENISVLDIASGEGGVMAEGSELTPEENGLTFGWRGMFGMIFGIHTQDNTDEIPVGVWLKGDALDNTTGATRITINLKSAATTIKQLDEKFIPDTIARVTAVDAVAGRMTTAEGKISANETAIEALQGLVGEDSVQTQIDAALKVNGVEKYALATDLAATNTEVAKKANDADLAAIAKTGSTDDLVQGAMTLIFDCGGASV